MKDYTEKNPAFSSTIRITDTTDPGNAQLLNEAPKQLLQNDLVLATRLDKVLGNTDGGDNTEFAEGLDAKNVVDAVNKVFISGNEKKSKLVDNLVARGIQASTDETWESLLDKVLDMTDTSGDTVTAAVLLSGYTAHNAAGGQITGTLADKTDTAGHSAEASLDVTNGRIKLQVPAEAKYGTVNFLYAAYTAIASLIGLTAAKLVKGNTILSVSGNNNNMNTSGATAEAGHILSGKKAGVKGSLVTGTMGNKAGTTLDTEVSQDDTYTYMDIPAAGYYDTNSKLRSANSNIQADLSQLSAAGTWGGGCNNSYSASATIPAGTANYVMVYVSLSQFPENGTHISVTNLTELPAFTITNRGYPGVKIFEVVDTTKSASVSAKAGGDYGSPSVTIRSLK